MKKKVIKMKLIEAYGLMSGVGPTFEGRVLNKDFDLIANGNTELRTTYAHNSGGDLIPVKVDHELCFTFKGAMLREGFEAELELYWEELLEMASPLEITDAYIKIYGVKKLDEAIRVLTKYKVMA